MRKVTRLMNPAGLQYLKQQLRLGEGQDADTRVEHLTAVMRNNPNGTYYTMVVDENVLECFLLASQSSKDEVLVIQMWINPAVADKQDVVDRVSLRFFFWCEQMGVTLLRIDTNDLIPEIGNWGLTPLDEFRGMKLPDRIESLLLAGKGNILPEVKPNA